MIHNETRVPVRSNDWDPSFIDYAMGLLDDPPALVYTEAEKQSLIVYFNLSMEEYICMCLYDGMGATPHELIHYARDCTLQTFGDHGWSTTIIDAVINDHLNERYLND